MANNNRLTLEQEVEEVLREHGREIVARFIIPETQICRWFGMEIDRKRASVRQHYGPLEDESLGGLIPYEGKKRRNFTKKLLSRAVEEGMVNENQVLRSRNYKNSVVNVARFVGINGSKSAKEGLDHYTTPEKEFLAKLVEEGNYIHKNGTARGRRNWKAIRDSFIVAYSQRGMVSEKNLLRVYKTFRNGRS